MAMRKPLLSVVIWFGCLLPAADGLLGTERLVLVAGGGNGGNGAPATEAKLTSPFGVEFDRSGALFIVELEGGHLHKVDRQGIFSTLGGNGTKGDAGDGGPVSQAIFNAMHNLAIDREGNLFLADTLNHRVRRVNGKTSTITPFAGSGRPGFAGDGGPATNAECHGVYCVAFAPDYETMYLADLENRRVRAVDMRKGTISTVAGNGHKGVPADGRLARESPLVDPRAVAADAEGRVYILERGGHALRVVDRENRIRTVAGTGSPGASGDGGPASQATLRGPKHLCIDRDGTIVIADTDNHLIRRYDPHSGKITRIAGSGRMGAGGLEGPPEEAELHHPHGVTVSPEGTLYIVDTGNDRVLKLVRE